MYFFSFLFLYWKIFLSWSIVFGCILFTELNCKAELSIALHYFLVQAFRKHHSAFYRNEPDSSLHL